MQQLSSMFSAFRDGMGLQEPVTGEPAVLLRHGFRRMLSLAALVVIGLGVMFSLKSDLHDDELRFESYLERSLDQDVLEMAALGDGDFSRDQVVGLLVSSTH